MPGIVASFNDAFEKLNESNKKSALTKEELINKILRYYLSNLEELKKIKVKLNNKRKDGSDWGEDEDEETLKEYLKAETRSNLKEKHEALLLKSTSHRSNNFPIELDGALGFFKPIISFMFLLFYAGNGGLIGMMSRFLHDKEVAKNPTIDLNEEEKSNSEYSYLFASAAKENKQYNAVYREITKTAESKEQVLNGMLRYVNHSLKNKSQSAEARKRLEEVENILLSGRNFVDESGRRYLCSIVNKNLDDALRKMNINVNVPTVLGREDTEKVNKIQTVKNIFAKLLDKVAERQRQLEEDPLTKAKIEEFNIFINEHKRKLLHFAIKTQVFAKGETLKLGVDLKEEYKDPKNDKEHDSYFDYWLSKVPSVAGEASFVNRGGVDKMIFRQFMRKPEHEAALGSCEDLVDIDAYKDAQKKVQEGRIKEFKEQVIASNVVVKEISVKALKVEKQIESLKNEETRLEEEYQVASTNKKCLIEQQTTKLGEQHAVLFITQSDLNNQVKLLQEEIVRNTIDTTMVELELNRCRAKVDHPISFSWSITPEQQRDNLTPALRKALQIFNFGDDPANAELQAMIQECMNKGVNDSIKLRTEYNQQTVSELFSILQERSNGLLQQTKRAQASLETSGERANAELPGGANNRVATALQPSL